MDYCAFEYARVRPPTAMLHTKLARHISGFGRSVHTEVLHRIYNEHYSVS